MSKSKKLKKTLVVSTFFMLSCVSLLAGTTYAWFTDNVKVENNHIVAGNLDVELYAKVNGNYEAVTGETSLFDENALWEPGHVEVVNLKVANVGSLALEYTLSVNIAKQTPGISVETNQPFHLSEYIEYATIEGDETFASREEALQAATRATPQKLSALHYERGYQLLPKDAEHPDNISEHYVTLIVFMPTDIGNEANHKTGTTAPSIDLGVNLSARQSSFESDSFDDKYDESVTEYGAQIHDKLYSSLTVALKNAKDGDTIKLTKDAEVKSIAYAPTTATKVTLDLNGHTLSTTKTSYLGNYKTGTALDFTIKNGTFNCADTAIWPDAGTKLTLDDVDLFASGNYGITLPSLKNNPLGNVELVVKNGSSIVGSSYAGIVNFGPYPVTIENSTVEGKYFGLSQNGQAAASAATYNITGSTFVATDPAGVGIYVSNTLTADEKFHTFNLTNSTVTGGTAVEVKYTNATIKGCTLIANAAELSATENGNGPCTQGYSLAVSTNPGTQIAGTVTVDEATTLTWKKGETEEAGKVFVYNPDGATTSVNVKGTAVSDTMTYTAKEAA